MLKRLYARKVFRKGNCGPSFTRLRVIGQINRIQYRDRNMLQRLSCIFLLFKPPWSTQQASISLPIFRDCLKLTLRQMKSHANICYSVFVTENGNF